MVEDDITRRIMEAARQGAKSVAGERKDVISDTEAEIGFQFERRRSSGKAPEADAPGWAFISGKRHARRSLMLEDKRSMELSADICNKLIDRDTPESILLQQSKHQASSRITAQERISAIQKLLSTVIDVINRNPDHIDQLILDLHYHHHMKFADVAVQLGMTHAATRRRWARLMWDVTDETMTIVRKDETMAMIFADILADRGDFRTSLMGLLGMVAAKGMSPIEDAIESNFP